jgi:anaerobic ribonucleoside-triphosphate reductase activating protein
MSGKREVSFIIEPDTGRITVESSRLSGSDRREVSSLLGRGSSVNCARPAASGTDFQKDRNFSERGNSGLSEAGSFKKPDDAEIFLYRLYHRSTVDGPGRRSVVQFAGCSIRCPGCYVPETHERSSGERTSVGEIVRKIEKRRDEHDGVTILGGEPFDQPDALDALVGELKKRDFHIVIYTGYTLEDLLSRKSVVVNRILAGTDVLIDGPYRKGLAGEAGEYRGSVNQRIICRPFSF